MNFPVKAFLIGQARAIRGAERSAIAKLPVEGPVQIGPYGLVGDEQADKVHHGGPHMALHLYPHDHHANWQDEFGEHPLLGQAGAFGSNLQVSGLLEADVNIGSRFRCGTALIEISQPRKPCWKIEHRFERRGMITSIVASGRSGWYFRVLEPGIAQAGDDLRQIEHGHQGWSVLRVFNALMGVHASSDLPELAQIAQLERLSPELRDRARKLRT